MKLQKINETLQYVTSKNFTFGLGEKQYQFGVAIEAMDLYEATGEDEYKDYPVAVSFQLVADKIHRSFQYEAYLPDGTNLGKLGLIAEAHSYMGGVPVDHVLTDEIRCGTEATTIAEATNFDLIADQFTAREAKVVTTHADFGTIAAQRGQRAEYRYLMFKDFEAAQKYIDLIIEKRISALSMLIGFILDRPINMIGETGWETVRLQVKGKNSRAERVG